MQKRNVLLTLVLAVCVGVSMMAFAQDDAKMGKEDKDMKTIQGQIVDLQVYLMSRSEGKNPTEAAKAAIAVTEEPAAGAADRAGTATRPAMGMQRVKALLVTEKDWLSKAMPGRDLYVVLHQRGAAAADPAMMQVGKRVKLTGQVADHDGVQAIICSKVEMAPAAGEK